MSDTQARLDAQAGRPARKLGGGWEIIGPPECPIMLRRTLLSTRWLKLLWHRFMPGASDEAHHDHPRSFITVVLRGGYDDIQPMGAYDARARLTDLGATREDLVGLLYAEPDDPATEARIGLLIGLAPSLVIIAAAGAYNVQGLDDNKRTDVEQLTNLYIRSFWRNGIATIMLDHETRGAYAIGSERKVGGADVHLGFSVITPISRGHSGLYKITTHKDRGGHLKRGTLAEMELRSDPETHEITCQLRPAEEVPEGEIWMPTKVMQKISELLEGATTLVIMGRLRREWGFWRDGRWYPWRRFERLFGLNWRCP
jgi:hypothetical protein